MRRHALLVTCRAGLASLAIAAVTYVAVPAVAPLATISAGVAILAFELTRIRATLARRLDDLDADISQIQPTLQLHRMLAPRHPLQPLRDYAIAPDCAVLLLELVAERRPEIILETGSGVSTIILAYALERLGRGRVIALEHDADHALRTRDELARHGLTSYAEIIHAPLTRVDIAGTAYRWYSPAALHALPDIDLIFDDGPPRIAGPMLRYASLPTLAPKLRPDGLFILDVVGAEERAILSRWRTELPEFNQLALPTKKGNVLISRISRMLTRCPPCPPCPPPPVSPHHPISSSRTAASAGGASTPPSAART